MDKQISTIKLVFGKAVVMNYKPESLGLSKVAQSLELRKKSLGKFGLFDSASPNFQTFYPGLRKEDFTPQDDDFIYPVVRALSQITVRKSYNPVSFKKPGVLKNSMGLLIGQTVYPNHEALVGNHLGVVTETEWQNAYTSDSGLKVPAGFLALLKIDAKTQPNIARGILMDPPSVHSVSVTVNFEWEQSHKNMEPRDFWMKMGTIVDNKLVERVATNILKYDEISFVPHGADPFAQNVDKNKKIKNPQYAEKAASLSNDDGSPAIFYTSYDSDSFYDQLSFDNDTHFSNDKNTNTMDLTKLTQKLQALVDKGQMKLKEGHDEITEENLQEYLLDYLGNLETISDAKTKLESDLNDTKTKLSDAETKVTELKSSEKTLQAEVKSLKEDSLSETDQKLLTAGKEALEDARKEAKRLYLLAKGDDVKESVVSFLASADLETLNIQIEEYQGVVENKYPATCKSCGSTEISRASSKETNSKGERDTPPEEVSCNDVASSFEQEGYKANTSFLHEEDNSKEK